MKVPVGGNGYPKNSKYIVGKISEIITEATNTKQNKIFVQTDIRRGLPLENISKVAGPFVEAWALEEFENIADDSGNQYQIINVESGKRLAPFDIILQFKYKMNNTTDYFSAKVDVKATDPDYIFIVLSLKHKVYSERNQATGMTKGIVEVMSNSVYDLKYISEQDLSYNSALGTG